MGKWIGFVLNAPLGTGISISSTLMVVYDLEYVQVKGALREQIAPFQPGTYNAKAEAAPAAPSVKTRDWVMQLKDWETTIQQFADESNREPTDAGKRRVLKAWRANLEKPPTALHVYQVDEIVREVRNRLTEAKVDNSK
jgi:hypothetical protein